MCFIALFYLVVLLVGVPGERVRILTEIYGIECEDGVLKIMPFNCAIFSNFHGYIF
jgi:hypothetical protein